MAFRCCISFLSLLLALQDYPSNSQMAPSNISRRSTRYKRQEVLAKCDEKSRNLHCSRSTPSTSSEESCDDGIVGCSTPKAQRFKIPETLSCPPAPMKRRLTTKCPSKKSPIAFFASPDIELFFFFAFQNIPA
ncbi:hypothetical protein OIU78_003546 [Salix suchowensis]|nr:hypothetical protein OIU78_003546 [Salix suchowensis]